MTPAPPTADQGAGLPTFSQLIAEPTLSLIDAAIVGLIGDAALASHNQSAPPSSSRQSDYAYSGYSTTAQVLYLLGGGSSSRGLQARH